MGQVVSFHLRAPAYPDTTHALDSAECVLLLGVRWWVADYRHGIHPIPRLRQAMNIAGPQEAAFPVDQLMAVIARTARQPIAIHCPRCPNLSPDEAQLLHAASLAQAGETALAERALRTALLSAAGAEFALGPLEGIGALFAEAKLLFSRRQSPVIGEPAAVQAWVSSAMARSIH